MKIEDIDKNFCSDANAPKEAEFFDTAEAPFSYHGVEIFGECYARIAPERAEKINEGVAALAPCSAGGRIRFSSNSGHISVYAKLRAVFPMPHAPYVLSAGFDIYRDGEYLQTIQPINNFSVKAYGKTVETDGKTHTYTIVMPCYGGAEKVFVGLDPGCDLSEAEPYKVSKPIIYYGSSITQGGCASRPGMTYQDILSRKFGADYINLGFSGSAKAEDEAAYLINDIISERGASIFVYDYDYNAPNYGHLEKTHERFFEIIRSENKALPVVMISKPNPSGKEDELRRAVIKRTYENARAKGDENVYFVNGADFAPNGDYTVDGVHLNDLGFYSMAKRLEEVYKKILGC